ncbi:MAG: ATP-binding protein [Myxococcaceae bacterium]|nr:ATP-binding protein [Myxococcaceae bacterium]
MSPRAPDTPVFREVVMTLGAVLALGLTVVQWVGGVLEPARATWQLGSAAGLVLLVLVAREGGPLLRRWAPVLLTGLCCLCAPLALGAEGRQTQLLVSLISVPLVVSLIFFDRFEVVLSASVAGTVAALLATPRLGLSGPETAEFVVSSAGVFTLAGACAWMYERQRHAELARELGRTEQLQVAERRQAQVERMALVGQLAAGVAHEINNPLAFVSSNVSVVKEHLAGTSTLDGEDPVDVLRETQEGLERIRQIVSDLKAFARDESDGGKPVHLADVVQEALRLASVRMPPGVHVECTGLSTVPLVKASHRKLVQVVLNLLVNAADALEAAKVKEPRVTLTLRRTEGGVAVDVADNGPGVSLDAQAHLFEPFFTTKPLGKGTGLGLAMSREMVRAMGGDLVLSPARQGACFTLEVPAEARRTPVEVPRPLVVA